ncbi:fungal-specific transcription factor domain-containing protein [Xylariaceae sp. FL0016]|nr:fungal-specific transcription factor domain-containing protein [Xylariaceae sp. FL0016]
MLRCDRLHPSCSRCKKRGPSSSCTYASKATASNQFVNATSRAAPTGVQDRIQHLEGLVLSLVQKSGGNLTQAEAMSVETTPPSTAIRSNASGSQGDRVTDENALEKPDPADFGSLSLSSAESRYQDQTHWTSILNAIGRRKDDDATAAPQETAQHHSLSAETSSASSADNHEILLLAGCEKISREEILAAFPSKDVADNLLSRCFDLLDLSSCAIHKVEFMKKYNELWRNPQRTPIMFVGLLFSMFAIAARVQDYSESKHQGLEDIARQTPDQSPGYGYREKAVQCLVLGEYRRGGPFTIETLIHYVASEYIASKDASLDVWLGLGIAVNLAMRMGYHRDPRNFKEISPYDGEMRRRVWTMLYHLDLGLSGQVGMPRNIKDAVVDTAEPRNLLDSDLDPDMIELPPARPDSEPTPVLISIAKNRLARMCGAVSDLVTSTTPSSYAQVLRVDRELQQTFDNLPEYCRVRSMAKSAVDAPATIVQRIYIRMTYHKAQVVLHRRYLASNNECHAYSRKTAVEAALQMLHYQHTIHESIQPLGCLYTVRWRITSITYHDFLLATSIVCFYLQKDSTAICSSKLERIRETITRAQKIWRISDCAEAKKALQVIDAVMPTVSNDKPDEHTPGTYESVPLDNMAESFVFSTYQDCFPGFQIPFFNSVAGATPTFPTDFSHMDAIEGPYQSDFMLY